MSISAKKVQEYLEEISYVNYNLTTKLKNYIAKSNLAFGFQILLNGIKVIFSAKGNAFFPFIVSIAGITGYGLWAIATSIDPELALILPAMKQYKLVEMTEKKRDDSVDSTTLLPGVLYVKAVQIGNLAKKVLQYKIKINEAIKENCITTEQMPELQSILNEPSLDLDKLQLIFPEILEKLSQRGHLDIDLQAETILPYMQASGVCGIAASFLILIGVLSTYAAILNPIGAIVLMVSNVLWMFGTFRDLWNENYALLIEERKSDRDERFINIRQQRVTAKTYYASYATLITLSSFFMVISFAFPPAGAALGLTAIIFGGIGVIAWLGYNHNSWKVSEMERQPETEWKNLTLLTHIKSFVPNWIKNIFQKKTTLVLNSTSTISVISRSSLNTPVPLIYSPSPPPSSPPPPSPPPPSPPPSPPSSSSSSSS